MVTLDIPPEDSEAELISVIANVKREREYRTSEEVRQGQGYNDTRKLLRTAFLTFGPSAYCIPDL